MMQCSEGKIEGTDLFITVSYTQPYNGYTLRSSLLLLLNIIIVLRTHYEILFEGFVVYLIWNEQNAFVYGSGRNQRSIMHTYMLL